MPRLINVLTRNQGKKLSKLRSKKFEIRRERKGGRGSRPAGENAARVLISATLTDPLEEHSTNELHPDVRVNSSDSSEEVELHRRDLCFEFVQRWLQRHL